MSLEYLLLLAAFFAVLGIVLPVVSTSAQQFLDSSDALLAKRIAGDVTEKASLLAFLAGGSQFSLEYFPAKGISIYSQGTNIFFESAGKQFVAESGSQQLMVKETFTKKFKIIISKRGKDVQVIAESS